MTAYAELQITSNFSFLRGGSHPEELVLRAAELGLSAIALTDRNTLAGVVRAHVAAKEVGIRFVVGARLDLMPKAASSPSSSRSPSCLCCPSLLSSPNSSDSLGSPSCWSGAVATRRTDIVLAIPRLLAITSGLDPGVCCLCG